MGNLLCAITTRVHNISDSPLMTTRAIDRRRSRAQRLQRHGRLILHHARLEVGALMHHLRLLVGHLRLALRVGWCRLLDVLLLLLRLDLRLRRILLLRVWIVSGWW